MPSSGLRIQRQTTDAGCHDDGGLLGEHTLRGYDSEEAGENSNPTPLLTIRFSRASDPSTEPLQLAVLLLERDVQLLALPSLLLRVTVVVSPL
ncbi:MAG: hypothetical protein EAZ30_17485 [Betaproteobacteria bacterium]|nr:MAG: hypothetical protein EAZ30_17485 [Betaproteobacteria bacterium]